METDPGTHWAILFLYFYENQMMAELASNNKTKGPHFGHGCTETYPEELELKLENQGP